MTNKNSCVSCDAGMYLADAGNDPAKHDTANDCSTCGLGKYSNLGSESCAVCPLGRFNDDAAADPTKHLTCQDCPKGQFQDSLGKSECFDCDIGRYNKRTGRTSVDNCEECDPCQAGSVRINCGGGIGTDGNKHTDSSGTCTLCGKGKYKASFGTWETSCTQCPEGKVALSAGSASDTSCRDCPNGKVASENAQECSGCAPGEFSLTATKCGVCQPCVEGSERIGCGGKNEGVCTACPGGWYKAEGVVGNGAVYTSKCLKCEAGTSTNGKVGVNRADGCVNCVAGSYSTTSGSPSCDNCVSGKYTGTSGSNKCSDCQTCTAGFQRYTATTGEKLLCGGSYQDAQNNIMLRNSAGTCNSCPNGRFKTAVASQGTYDVQCLVCPNGKTHSSSRDSCVLCPSPFVGAAGNGLCATECAVVDGSFPNEARTACLKLTIASVSVGRQSSGGGRRQLSRLERRLIKGTIDVTSGNNVVSVQVSAGVSIYDYDTFVLLLCRVDDVNCDRPLANTTSVIAAATPGEIIIPATGPTCPTGPAFPPTMYYVQVGYHHTDTATNTYLGDSVVVVRSSDADDFEIVPNIPPTITRSAVVLQPEKIYPSTPFFSCSVDMSSADDVDSEKKNLELVGVTFETGLTTTSGVTWSVSAQRSGLSPYAGRDFDVAANYVVRCGATLTDGCGDTEVTIPSGTSRVVQSLELFPFFGPARLATNVHVVGAGFIAGSSEYKCKFSGDGRTLTVAGTARNQSHVECNTGAGCPTNGQPTGGPCKFFGSAESQSVVLNGPVMKYAGCFNGADIKNSMFLVRMGGDRVRASTCQYMCFTRDQQHDMYFLHGGACFCGKSNRNQLPSSPLSPTSSCRTACPELLNDDTAFMSLGCFNDDSGNRDLPLDVTSTITGTVNEEQCSLACTGYAFFGLQNSASCYCGNSYGKEGAATDCPRSNRNTVYRQSIERGSSGLRSSTDADRTQQQCGTAVNSVQGSPGSTRDWLASLLLGQATVYSITPTPVDISAGYFQVSASPPGLVDPPTVNDVPGGVSVSWLPPSFLGGSSDVDSFYYKIMYLCVDCDVTLDDYDNDNTVEREQLVTKQGSLSDVVLALKPAKRYKFRVIARNAVDWGESNPALTSVAEAGLAVPPEPPAVLQLSEVNFESVTLTFPPSEYDGGVPINKYFIKYAMSSEGCANDASPDATVEEAGSLWYEYADKRIRREGLITVNVPDEANGGIRSIVDASGNVRVVVQEPFQENSDGSGGWNSATTTGLKAEQKYTFQIFAYNKNKMPSFSVPSPALEVTTDAATVPRYVCAPPTVTATQTLVFSNGDMDEFINGGTFKLMRGEGGSQEETACIKFNGDEICEGTSCSYNLAGADVKAGLEALPSAANAAWTVSAEIEGQLEHGDVRVVMTFDPPAASMETLAYSVVGCAGPKSGTYNSHGAYSPRANPAPIDVAFEDSTSDGCTEVRGFSTTTCVSFAGKCSDGLSYVTEEECTNAPVSGTWTPYSWTTLETDPFTGLSGSGVYQTAPCPNLAAAFNWTSLKDGGTGTGASGQVFKLRPGVHQLEDELAFPVRNMKLIGYGSAVTTLMCAPGKRCLVADSAHAHPKDGITFGSVIKALRITGGSSTTFGGGILIDGSSRPIVFEDVLLDGNDAVAGGGIAILSCTARIDFLSGVKILNNSATHFGGGLLVVASQQVGFDNMELVGNRAAYGGGMGALSEQRLVTYLPTSVTGTMGGGGSSSGGDDDDVASSSIEIRTSITFSNSTMSENTATDGEEGSGGAVYSYESDVALINDAKVKNNKASVSGGGCFFQASTVSILDSSLQDNHVVGTRGKGGGFSCISSTVKVKESTIEQNSAGQDGGAISATFCPITMTSVTVSSNKAVAGRGGGLNAELMCEINIKNSLFQQNTASILGAGVFAEEVLSCRITGSTFAANKAGTQREETDETSGGGGAVGTLSSQNIMIADTRFISNAALGAAGGGALNLNMGDIDVLKLETSSFRPVVSNCNFTTNLAPAGGGGALKWTASPRAMTDFDPGQDDPVLWVNNNALKNTALYGDVAASAQRTVFVVEGPSASWSPCGLPFYYIPRGVSYCKPNNQCPSFVTSKSGANKRTEGGGKSFNTPLKVQILDFYGRIIKSSRSIVQVVNEVDSDTTFSGTTAVVAVGGVATFADLTVNEPPTSGDDLNEIQRLTLTSDDNFTLSIGGGICQNSGDNTACASVADPTSTTCAAANTVDTCVVKAGGDNTACAAVVQPSRVLCDAATTSGNGANTANDCVFTVGADCLFTTGDGNLTLSFSNTMAIEKECVDPTTKKATARIAMINGGGTAGFPEARAVEKEINRMSNVRQTISGVTVTIDGDVATASHSDTLQIFPRFDDVVTITEFSSIKTDLSTQEFSVIGTPTRWSFSFDVSSISIDLNGTSIKATAEIQNAVTVTRDYAEGATKATYNITFSGKQVNGDVPALVVVDNCCNVEELKQGVVPIRTVYEASITVPGTLLPELPPFGANLRDCIPGEYLQGGFKCTECSPGKFSINMNSEECTPCEQGKAQPYTGRDMCYDCSYGTAQNSPGQAECNSCEQGKWTDGTEGNDVCANECPSGTFGSKKFVKIFHYCQLQTTEQVTLGGGCVQCPTGKFDPLVGTFCMKEITQEVGDCIGCPAGWNSPVTGNVRCLKCRPGYYASELETVDCPLCGAGKYSKTGSTSCDLQCRSGTYKTENMTVCDDCPPGRSSARLGEPEQERQGLGACGFCDPGRFSNKGQELCDKCAQGTASSLPGAAYKCPNCLAGRYAPLIGYEKCVACEPGLFNDEPCDENTCKVRSETINGVKVDGDNTACAAVVQPSRVSCDAATTSGNDGDTANDCIFTVGLCESYNDCQMCGAGQATEGDSNATECIPCTSGKYGTSHTHEERVYNARYAKCEDCKKNTFSNLTGVKECQACPFKTFTRNRTGASECEPCWRGEIFPSGGQECIKCPGAVANLDRGTYSFVAGDDRGECHSCPSGSVCEGMDNVNVQWGWWRSSGRTHEIDEYGATGKCTLNGKPPVQCGDACVTSQGEGCETIAAGTDGKSVAHVWRCDQRRDVGEMFDECGVRRHVMLCDGNEPGTTCVDFLSKVKRDGTGFNFEGEAEREVAIAFSLAQGDITKTDGSILYLPDSCNACRLTKLVTDVQIIRMDAERISMSSSSSSSEEKEAKEETEKETATQVLAFEVGFENYTTTVGSDISAYDLKQVLERLPTMRFAVDVRKRGSTDHSLSECPILQEKHRWEARADPPNTAELKSACEAAPGCWFDSNAVINHCKVLGVEWLVTFRHYNGEPLPELSTGRFLTVAALPDSPPPTDYSKVNITRASGRHRRGDYPNQGALSNAASWPTGETVSVLHGTKRRVICNAENGRTVVMNVADDMTCYEFDVEQSGSVSFNATSETWMPVTQQVRIAMLWNETVLEELVNVQQIHPDEDAPAHKCNVVAGYSGRMCQVCLNGFGRSGRFGCKRCSADPVTTGLVSLVGLGAAIGYVSLFVYVVIKDAGSTSTAGSVQKILLNHFQVVSICVNYPLNWPSELLSMFNYFSFLSDISEKVLDLDCALKDPVIFGWTGLEPFFLLQLFYSVIPVLMIFGFIIFWLIKGGCIHHCCGGAKKHKMENMKIVLTEVPDELKAKYEKRLVHEKLLAKQHMFRYAAKMSKIRDGPLQGAKGLTTAVEAKMHKEERKEALHHVQGLTRILTSTFKATGELTKEDRTAVAKMRCREFVDHCRNNHIHLREIWMQYDVNHSGSIPYAAFDHIVRSLGFVWTPDEFKLVCSLLDQNANDGKDKIELHNLVNFGKTTMDKIVVTTLVILYILYPTVARQTFKLLACRGGFQDGPTTSYLLYDLSLSCWTGTHMVYTAAIGLPTVILYIIGFPMYTYYILNKNKHRFGDDEIMFRYGVLHAGYRHKVFYWEAMISLRKAALIGVSVFTLTWGVQVQAFIGLFFIIAFMAVTIRSMPYENDHLNNLENWSLGMAFITLYCGLIFYSDKLPSKRHNQALAWFLIALNGIYVMWLVNTLLVQYCKRYGCRKANKHAMAKVMEEANKTYANDDSCKHLTKKSKTLSNETRMALGLGKFAGGGVSAKGKTLKLEQRDMFLSRLSHKKQTGLMAKFRTKAYEAVHMSKAYDNIKKGQETLTANHRKQQLRRKGSSRRLEIRLKKRARLKKAVKKTIDRDRFAIVHPQATVVPEAGTFEHFQHLKQQAEFAAFLENKRRLEMAEFSKMNKPAPVHTKKEDDRELKIYATKHQHVTAKEITGDLVDFIAEGHSKAEVKEIVATHANITNALGDDVVNFLDDYVDAVNNEAEKIVLEEKKVESNSTGNVAVAEKVEEKKISVAEKVEEQKISSPPLLPARKEPVKVSEEL